VILASTLLRICGKACLQIDRASEDKAREAVTVSAPSCEICGGSNNRRAAIACLRRLRRYGIRRVVIVGGTANLRQELDRLLAADDLAIRWVDGLSTSRSSKDALADRRWAQLVVIWGPTPLRHAVSRLYTEEPPADLRIVTVPRRGIEALCAEIVRSYS
jgi:hypothetical protein